MDLCLKISHLSATFAFLQRAAEDAVEREKEKEKILRSNPLVGESSVDGDGILSRRWDDDVVFKNQAKTAPKLKQRFINDTVRSDFHKKFLTKYIL